MALPYASRGDSYLLVMESGCQDTHRKRTRILLSDSSTPMYHLAGSPSHEVLIIAELRHLTPPSTGT